MAAEQKKIAFLEAEEAFRRNAFIIISEMVKMSNQTQENTSALVNEVLHSIFFLGEVSFPPFSPRMVLGDDDIYEFLKELHPEPFQLYSSQLPRRSPFSCVLDMIVHLTGRDNEGKIREGLNDFNKKLMRGLNSKMLFSSTICVSCTNTPDSVRYYGVSMSTFGRRCGKIMTAASCCSSFNNYWDDYVADAVMTYCPDKVKKEYFDGTITLPVDVRCEAYNIRGGNKMHPCKSCGDLFGFDTTDEKKWPYGNCAEVESLSKLLKNEEQVKQGVIQLSATVTEENRQRARQHIIKHLKKLLQEIKFEWDDHFYVPQSAQVNE